MYPTKPVLVCTNCGKNLEEEFAKLKPKQSSIFCTCGWGKEVRKSILEDEKHISYEQAGKDPMAEKMLDGLWRLRA